MNIEVHEYWMRQAIHEAEKAKNCNEVPIGAVIVRNGSIISSGYNLRETTMDALAHAELIAIRNANQTLTAWRLLDCDLYVTLEPCPMCAGAILQARIKNLFFGASDPKAGCCGTLMNLLQDSRFNHQTNVIGGILESECADLLKSFFKKLRK
jgi:tRNA(adenine34) deaminase